MQARLAGSYIFRSIPEGFLDHVIGVIWVMNLCQFTWNTEQIQYSYHTLSWFWKMHKYWTNAQMKIVIKDCQLLSLTCKIEICIFKRILMQFIIIVVSALWWNNEFFEEIMFSMKSHFNFWNGNHAIPMQGGMVFTKTIIP